MQTHVDTETQANPNVRWVSAQQQAHIKLEDEDWR